MSLNNESFEILKFAPLFDYNLSMLGNALEQDLKDFPKYEEDYQVGHKLGGTFSEVGRQILTPKLMGNLPKELSLPMHHVYNLSNERLSFLSSVFHQNYDIIRGKGKSFFVEKNTAFDDKETKIEEKEDM